MPASDDPISFLLDHWQSARVELEPGEVDDPDAVRRRIIERSVELLIDDGQASPAAS